ncbi:LuxR C-terminal-related transcriptional regulator [Flammeovirgaceae bacterium SG7u.111]|nr:LuxR C-terminal-related transcriptional regulator [Flammeovirgaceae bacterium SG7u.132]WPO35264.1 LuxR C-terminal-related transcriptional regulator [Flammeovirgaceae bacterium SG7u.111]
MKPFDVFKDFIKQFREDRKTDYKLINNLIRKNAYLTSNQFCYFVDYQKFSIVYTSAGVEKVLGYKPEEFNIEKYFDIIHPEDKELVKAIATAGFLWCKENPFEPMESVLSVTYRVRHANGHYLNSQRQSVILDRSEKNNVLATVGILTVFSGKELDTEVKYSFTGPGTAGFHVPEVDKDNTLSLSKRELMVLKLMAKGLSSKEIAEQLFISKSTVDGHRRQMLRKSGLKNSIELVVLGIKNGLV